MILDGWGIAQKVSVSAIDAAKTPYINSLYKKYPHGKLQASGLAVGLPEGQMGNSEVGHMNLGAGRVVYQDLVRINKAVEDRELDKNPVLLDAINYAKSNNKSLNRSQSSIHTPAQLNKAVSKAATVCAPKTANRTMSTSATNTVRRIDFMQM